MKIIALALLLATPTLAQANIAADMEYFPKEVSLLTGFDLGQLKNTNLFKTLYGAVESTPAFKKFTQEMKDLAGIDLKNDTQTMIFGFNMATGEPDQFILSLKGKFSEANLKKLESKDKSVKKTPYKGVNLYEDDEYSIAFFKGRLIFGNTNLLKSLVDGTRAINNKALSREISLVKNNPNIWMAFALTPKIKAQIPKDEVGDLSGVTATFWLKQDLKGAFSATFGSDKEAQKVAAQAQAGLAQSLKDPQMANMPFKAALERVKISSQGNRVVGSASLTAAELQMIQMFLMPMIQAQINAGAGAAETAPSKAAPAFKPGK